MKKILIIAPHPDDEILGCGGTLHKFRNKKIYWMILTKMSDTKIYTKKKITDREKEIRKVAKYLNIKNIINLNFEAANFKDLIMKMSNEIKKIEPDTIFSPFLHDAHSDHFFCTYALNHILKTFRYPFIKQCYLYETLSETNQNYVKKSFFRPNVYFNISKNLQTKLKLVKIYKSEIKKHPFPRSIEAIKALAILRGSESGYKYAESFKLILKKND